MAASEEENIKEQKIAEEREEIKLDDSSNEKNESQAKEEMVEGDWHSAIYSWEDIKNEDKLDLVCCCCIAPCQIAMTLTEYDESNCLFNLACVSAPVARSIIRNGYDIEGNCVEDCLSGICCPCLVSRQLHNEVVHRKKQADHNYEAGYSGPIRMMFQDTGDSLANTTAHASQEWAQFKAWNQQRKEAAALKKEQEKKEAEEKSEDLNKDKESRVIEQPESPAEEKAVETQIQEEEEQQPQPKGDEQAAGEPGAKNQEEDNEPIEVAEDEKAEYPDLQGQKKEDGSSEAN